MYVLYIYIKCVCSVQCALTSVSIIIYLTFSICSFNRILGSSLATNLRAGLVIFDWNTLSRWTAWADVVTDGTPNIQHPHSPLSLSTRIDTRRNSRMTFREGMGGKLGSGLDTDRSWVEGDRLEREWREERVRWRGPPWARSLDWRTSSNRRERADSSPLTSDLW